jgi:HAD superfamily hydrolase (TIGR01490 family)
VSFEKSRTQIRERIALKGFPGIHAGAIDPRVFRGGRRDILTGCRCPFESVTDHSLPDSPPPGIALFDLDGTLLPWDCQLLFRHFVTRREPWRVVFLPVFLAFLPLAPLLGAAGMKRVFLSFLFGMPKEALEDHAEAFSEAVMLRIYPELRAEIGRHRASGNLLILASASPEFYVRHIGEKLGFDLTLGTQVEPGHLFPDLDNHKGAAKVERLMKLLPASYFEDGCLRNSHGYTDSTADLPMLGICQRATLVNPKPALTAIGGAEGWTILRPARPWRSAAGYAARSLCLLLGIGRNPAG